ESTREMIDRSAAPPLAPISERLSDRYLTAGQIGRVIRRERGRADRARGQFSLLLFRTAGGAHDQRGTRRLARIIARRVRETDEVGRYGDGSLCAVLPDTAPTGAACLARNVCAEARQRGIDPVCIIYSYPSNWFDDNGAGG